MTVLPCRCYVDTDVFGRELVTHGTAAFPIACYHAASQFDAVPPHWHNELEIIIVTKGDLDLHVQMEDHCLHAGTGMVVNANVLHAASPGSPDADFHSLVFSPLLIAGDEHSIFWNKYLEPLISDPNCPFLILSPDTAWQDQLIQRALTAWEEARSEQAGFEFRIRAALSECVFLLSQNIDHQASDPADLKTIIRSQRLKNMLAFIHTHYSEPITLADIAGSVSVSTTECLRCFREGLKLSPIQYMKKHRLIVAAGYLKTTDWPVNEIGSRCGFREMGYFAAQFGKLFGMTPTEYRRHG